MKRIGLAFSSASQIVAPPGRRAVIEITGNRESTAEVFHIGKVIAVTAICLKSWVRYAAVKKHASRPLNFSFVSTFEEVVCR